LFEQLVWTTTGEDICEDVEKTLTQYSFQWKQRRCVLIHQHIVQKIFGSVTFHATSSAISTANFVHS